MKGDKKEWNVRANGLEGRARQQSERSGARDYGEKMSLDGGMRE